MKKLLLIISLLAIISVLTLVSIRLMNKKGRSVTELIEFAIKDPSNVDRVIITDQFSRVFEIRKNGSEWTDKDGACVTQESALFVIDAIKNIEFKGYLPDNSHKRFINLMAASHTKVEIYENGVWSKTWYIGPASQDHYGQIMLLESKEDGKSDIPVLMKIKGVNGIIEPRFFADPGKWMCTNIFRLGIDDISEVDVRFYDEPQRSFEVSKKGHQFTVKQQGKLLQGVDTSMIFRYLQRFNKVHFDVPNYELSEKQVDSLRKTKPFCVLSVTETNGKTTKLRMFRINTKRGAEIQNVLVEDVDANKFWCELPNKQLVKCQYFAFNPLLLGHVYFPMDLSMLKTHDGIQKKEE